MANHSNAASGLASAEVLEPAAHFFQLGSELLGEVQKIVGTTRVRAVRLSLGGRVLKDIKINPVTAIATVAVVVAAVVISNLKVEVIKDSPMEES